jgi:putative oxidoreductase
MRVLFQWLARILLSLIFLWSGLQKIVHFSSTRQFMAQNGMPWTGLLLVGAIVVEIGGGLSLFLGFKAKWSALIIAIYLIPTTLIFHGHFSDQAQFGQFLKNLAIIGGLLMVAAFNGGKVSLDGFRKKA